MEAVVVTWIEDRTTVQTVVVVELLNKKQAVWYSVAFVAPWMEVGGKVEEGM